MTDQLPPDPYDDKPSPTPSQVPHCREAEESCLGCVLINQDSYFDVAELINSNDFYIHRHQWIWDAFVNLSASKMAIDIITVSEELDRVGKLAEIGGFAYLTGLVGKVPSSLNITSYARIVEAHSVRRKMITKANKIAQLAYDESKPVEDMLHEYDKLVTQNSPTSSSLDETQDSDEASLELLEKIQNKIATGVLSHFPLFDSYDALGGFPVGATLLLGDSSFGKSTFGLQICEQNALAGKTALYIGLESTNAQMVVRRVGGASGVTKASKKMRTASLTPQEEAALVNTITNDYQGKYSGRLKLNSAAYTIKQVETAVRNHKPAICVVDQISQIIDAPSTNPTVNLKQNFSRLKAIGKKYNCAMIVVHTISAEESKAFFAKNQKANSGNQVTQKNSMPNINAIPWASEIKFLTDVFLFLVPEANQKLSGASTYEIIIWILKDRDGNRFVDCWFNYDLVYQWFTDKIAPYKSQAQRPSGPVAKQVTATFYEDDSEPEFEKLNFEGVQ